MEIMTTTASRSAFCLPGGLQTLSASCYRHNPYAFTLLQEKDRERATESFGYIYSILTDEGRTSPAPPQQRRKARRGVAGNKGGSKYDSSCRDPEMQQLDSSFAKSGGAADSSNDDGVSETSSDSGSHYGKEVLGSNLPGFSVTSSQSHPGASSATAAATAIPAAVPSVIRYASVNFRFGSAWFVAPFRTFTGDMVVVQYPGNNSLHMGLVSAITTAKPITFYTEDNMDPNYLSPEELQTVPRLLRHARDFDKETKLDLRRHDLSSLANARKLGADIGAPVQFLDAEWLLDLSAVTFLVKVFGSTALADKLVDELAMQEGAEVVFTYPVSSTTMY
ncbi:conserved hypothetical protein [Leishmania mexicana MHOM/GT/2001/U1103]|uniref:Uncharacterized protein n=1 Tax=Leishmania mexicana (strain MHOM/GT/2001/U1103) TaxID=929439 RepID=E9ATT2_LEIMU|nr:conserved hypothetical protein [Leishmania mexicana MHOM/GT/2001/U1103]CBZ26357.1 conserved hypothetical protein [Leishmania mexicana MHOM/GT/2001/U1103]